jgi:type II secretory pathway predicted ATPase ExeA
LHPFQHFRLKRPPFEAAPDPRVFCPTAPHAEALATLEYAIYSRKPCTVLIGESGTGKTLLARKMAATASLQASVLWLHGLGQPESHSELHVFPRGALCGAAPSVTPTTVVFSDWLRDGCRLSPSTVLIVDNADELPPHGWRDVLILLSREVLFAEPVRIGLFGSPALLRRMALPAMVQIRRRIFRTSVLQPLTRREICAYVSGRLAAAGGRAEEIFAVEALDQIHRLTRGIPAAINQLCENAMLEAIGAGRPRVSAADILAAAQALSGARLPLQAAWKRVALLNEPNLRMLSVPAAAARRATRVLPAPPAPTERSPGPARPAAAPPTTAAAGALSRTDVTPTPLFMQQLQQLEDRLQNALTSMRRACAASEAAFARARTPDGPAERPPLTSRRLARESARPEQKSSERANQDREVQVD